MVATGSKAARSSAAHEIRLIQIGRSALGLDDDTYRAMLARLSGGKTSSKALTSAERAAVLVHMKAAGFVVRPKAGTAAAAAASAETGWMHEPQMRKLRLMWYLLADDGHVERPADTAACNAAVEAWARRQLGEQAPESLRWATGLQLSQLTEGLKAWCRRVMVAVE